jgi:hypothetical protein
MHKPPAEHDTPRALSEHDPSPGAPAGRRPPVLLIIVVVLVVTGFVVLHLTGVVGPGSH